jgi:hypothetical protein
MESWFVGSACNVRALQRTVSNLEIDLLDPLPGLLAIPCAELVGAVLGFHEKVAIVVWVCSGQAS